MSGFFPGLVGAANSKYFFKFKLGYAPYSFTMWWCILICSFNNSLNLATPPYLWTLYYAVCMGDYEGTYLLHGIAIHACSVLCWYKHFILAVVELFQFSYTCTIGQVNLLVYIYKAEKPSVCPSVRPHSIWSPTIISPTDPRIEAFSMPNEALIIRLHRVCC